MSLNKVITTISQTTKSNSTVILASLAASGTVTTAYLASKASFKASRIIHQEDEARLDHGAPFLTSREAFNLTWKLYIPAALSATATIASIFGGARIGVKKTAAAYSLLAISEKAFDEYKEKVVEQIGPKKEQALRDSIAQDRVTNSAQIIVSGSGTVLCYEMHTGRYFNSDMETLRKAENTVNAKMIRENEATLNDFYYLVGLPHTSYSSSTGWTSDRIMELRFSTVMSEDNRPCLAFEYSYVKPI